MAGGRGRRLYPASRWSRPKQFLAPAGGPSLLRRTADRARFADEVYAITPPEYAEDVAEEVPEAGLLVEPAARNTGPALVYAAARIQEQVGEAALVCLPTDHHVAGDAESTYKRAAFVATERNAIVTIGIEPDRPETGYGYIEPGTEILDGAARLVDTFTEKPDAETAQRFTASDHLWNSGVFAWTPQTLLSAAADSPLQEFVKQLQTGDIEHAYTSVESVSVDRAIVERTEDVVVVDADFEWDDVGSWDALGRVFGTDLAPASCRIDSEGTIVASDGAHISVVDVENMVVAAYDDHVLVVPRDASQRVREVAERVEK
jgi:mannose-1-phosphate guanylyltransferase